VTDDGAATLDTNPDAFPEWARANFDSIRISKDDLLNGTFQAKEDKEGQSHSFLYSKAPEQWELNIISLEHGEWNSGMKKDAFGKYKKERPALTGLFGANVQLSASARPGDVRKKEETDSEKSPARSSKKKKTQPRRADTGIKKSKSATDRKAWITPKKTKT